MDRLTKEEKLQVMHNVTDIASSVTQGKILWDLQSIESLVDKLYKCMVKLIEDDADSSKGSSNE